MRIAIGFGAPGDGDWKRAAEFIHDAERIGVDAVWTAETWGYDAATPVAWLAAHTERIQLGTGIMQLLSRTPAMMAMTAMSLDAMSGGRFRLGLGASGPQVVEGWHGQPFGRTLPRIRDAVAIARMVMRGERVAYKGEYFELPRQGGEGKALRTSAAPVEIPIYLATLGVKSLRLTGEIADGWFGTSFMPEHADIFLDSLREGAESAGRSLADIDIQVNGGVVDFSEDLERLIPPRKPGLAFSLGAMGSRRNNFYNAAYRRAGYADEALRVQSLWLDRKREEAAAAVPDELVLQTNMLGGEAAVRDRLRRHHEAGVNTIYIQPAGDTPNARLDTLEQLVALSREVGDG